MRVVIVGAGQVAHRHADAFEHNPETEIVAIVEPVRERAEAFARQYGLRPMASLRELLDAGQVDAVSICAPHRHHRELTCMALEHGLHVLLEKPIATTVEDGAAILEAAERSGRVLMLGFVHRFRPEVAEARRLIADGAIGLPATLLDRFCSLGGEHPPRWVWSRDAAGGGVLMYRGDPQLAPLAPRLRGPRRHRARPPDVQIRGRRGTAWSRCSTSSPARPRLWSRPLRPSAARAAGSPR